MCNSLYCCCCCCFFAKIGKNGIELKIKALLNFNSLNAIANLEKGGLYVVFDILFQI